MVLSAGLVMVTVLVAFLSALLKAESRWRAVLFDCGCRADFLEKILEL